MRMNAAKAIGLSMLWAVITASCAHDLSHHLEEDELDEANEPHIISSSDSNGITTTRVDASEEARWVYFHLESQTEVHPSAPLNSTEWDLAFQRFKIKINGGVSGVGDMELTALSRVDFMSLSQAPIADYRTDQSDGDDEDEDEDLAFLSEPWFAYNSADHTLEVLDQVYALRSTTGQYYRLQMLDYYDESGSPGHPSFGWAEITEPESSAGLRVDASAAESWTYLNVASASVVEISDPSTSKAWDLAFSRTQIRTNGATSGSGFGAAQTAEQSDYDLVDAAPSVGFIPDRLQPLPGPPGSGETSSNPVLGAWYHYDSAAHTLTPKDEVFLVRTAEGDYGKLTIHSYQDGIYGLKVAPVTRAIATHTSTIEASDGETWVYLSFRLGELIVMTEPGSDNSWDLGVSRTKLQSNSGTSGAGRGGVVDPETVELADLDAAPTDGYASDELLPLPGPPGSGEYSGNPVLATWFDYDPNTHTVSPKDKVFALRTADEGFVKLKIADYVGGLLTIEWAYAGPSWNQF